MPTWNRLGKPEENEIYVGTENVPYINYENGDTKNHEPPSPVGKREASVGLVGFWKHARAP
eukprot:930449-Pelagomonas_calceolata.AAC.1